MKKYLVLLSSLVFATITSCTVNPFEMETQKIRIASTGGSVFSKAEQESGFLTQANGSTMGYSRNGRNETGGITTIALQQAIGKIGVKTLDNQAATDQAKIAAEAAKTKGQLANEALKIQQPVELLKATPIP